MNAAPHIVEPDARVLERGGHRIQEDTDGHPLLVPDPEGILLCIGIEAADLLQMGRQFAVKGAPVPPLLEELGPLPVVDPLMEVPQFVHKGCIG